MATKFDPQRNETINTRARVGNLALAISEAFV